MQAQSVIPAGSRVHNPSTEEVELHAVYGRDGSANKEWAKSTPSGSLKLAIDNSAVHGFFKPGREYYVDIHEVPVEPAALGG